MDKTIKTLLIILLLILIIGFTGVFTIIFTNKADLNFNNTKLVYEETIEQEFNAINISTVSLDTRIVKSIDGKANVKIYDFDDKGISVQVEDETLVIDNKNRNSYCFLCFGKREVVISLPEKEYNLLIKSTSGDIVSKADLNTVSIISTSGDVELNRVKDATIKLTSGDIGIKEVNNIEIDTSSGDVEIRKINSSVNIKTISGDIDIDDLTITSDSSIKVTSGDVTINKSANDFYVDAKATSGDIKIADNNRRAEYELKITAKSGDITVR